METFGPSLVEKLYRSKCNAHSKKNCEWCCVQKVNLDSSSIGKCLQERERPFSTEFESVMNSCFIQYNAAHEENRNVAQEVNALSERIFVSSQV